MVAAQEGGNAARPGFEVRFNASCAARNRLAPNPMTTHANTRQHTPPRLAEAWLGDLAHLLTQDERRPLVLHRKGGPRDGVGRGHRVDGVEVAGDGAAAAVVPCCSRVAGHGAGDPFAAACCAGRHLLPLSLHLLLLHLLLPLMLLLLLEVILLLLLLLILAPAPAAARRRRIRSAPVHAVLARSRAVLLHELGHAVDVRLLPSWALQMVIDARRCGPAGRVCNVPQRGHTHHAVPGRGCWG